MEARVDAAHYEGQESRDVSCTYWTNEKRGVDCKDKTDSDRVVRGQTLDSAIYVIHVRLLRAESCKAIY